MLENLLSYTTAIDSKFQYSNTLMNFLIKYII